MFKKILSIAVFTCLLSLSTSAKDIQKANLTAVMDCSNCKNKIEKTLKATKGVEKVNVNIKEQSVKVEYDRDIVSETDLVEAINKTDGKFDAKSASNKSGCSVEEAKSCNKPCSPAKGAKSCGHNHKEAPKDSEGCKKMK